MTNAAPIRGTGPRVSIIVPCYRQARFLKDAIDSVIAQTHRDWECLIVDDGSPDETRDIAQALIARDRRVSYIRKPNGGTSSARNVGLDRARGEYIQFLDADDLLLPDKLASALSVVDAARPSLVIHDFWLMDEAGRRFDSAICSPEFVLGEPLHDIALRWETGLSIAINAMLFDARLFGDPPLRFDETLSNHEDWDCWMRVLERQPSIVRVRDRQCVYRVHGASMSRDEARNWQGFRAAIDGQIARHAQDPSMLRMLSYKRRLTDDFYGRTWRSAAIMRLRRGVVARVIPEPIRLRLLERLDLSDLRAHGWQT